MTTERVITGEEQGLPALGSDSAAVFRALYQVAVAVGGILDPTELARAVADHATSLIGADAVGLYLWLPREQALRPLYSNDARRDTPESLVKPGEGGAGQAFLTGRPVVVDDYPSWEHRGLWASTHGVQAVCAVPLRVADRTIGALSARFYHRHAPTQVQVEILELLAAQIAPALEAARLRDEAAQEREARERLARAEAAHAEAELLTAIASRAAGEADLEQLLAGALGHLQQSIAFTGGSIALLETSPDDGAESLVIRAATGPFAATAVGQRVQRGESPVWHVIDTGEPYVSDNRMADSPSPTTPVLAYAVVPLASRGREGRRFGVLEVDSTAPGVFDPTDVSLLRKVATVLSGSIEIAERYATEVRALEQAERAIRVRDEFLSIASHELRTPVTAIRAYPQLLLRQLRAGRQLDTAFASRALLTIERQTSKLSRLVSQLLDVSRIESGHLALDLAPADVMHIVEDAVQAVAQSQLPPGSEQDGPVHIDVVEMPDTVPAVLDALRIEQVLANLLGNAVKYSPQGGRVEVRVRTADEGATIRVEVRDWGVGVPPGDADHIFDRFYRAHHGAQLAGIGIGLYVSQQIALLHGGSIELESPPDGGSRFTLVLPSALPDH